MLNQLVLVGKILEEPKKEGNKITLVITTMRSFKNTEGIYESDDIPVIVWNGVAEQTKEYCHKGDTIGIKARIQMNDNNIEIVAEKITILTTKKED